MALFKLEKEIDLFTTKIKPKPATIDMSTLSFILTLKVWYFHQCTEVENWKINAKFLLTTLKA